MATPVPGTILTNPAQTGDIGSFFLAVLMLRQRAYTEAKPMARGLGLLSDIPSEEQAYAIPFGPIALGKLEEYADGNRPGAMKPQGTMIKGSVTKRGITPLRMFEGDRTAARVPYLTSSILARGRAERLMEDRLRARALENGTSAVLQPSYDGKAFYATDHYVDPVAASGSQANLITGALTPDRLGDAKVQFRTFLAENNTDPIYSGFEPDFLLEVPPALEKVAAKICERSHIAEGNAALENIESGTQYYVNTFLSSSVAWYLHVINTGMPMCYRVVHRPMQRWDKGPESALYQDTKAVEIYADEWTDYRLTAWELSVKSTGV